MALYRTLSRDPDDQNLPRRATIATESEGQPLGACIFLTASDLALLGIDSGEVEHFEYTVEEGRLQLTERDG